MKILLQLLIFAIFIFSNGYQSLVTSFMLNPVQQKLLKTIDEVLDSNLKIYGDWKFEQLYKENPKYQKVIQDKRVVEFDLTIGNWTGKMVEKNLAITQHCKLFKIGIEILGDGKSWKGLYQIPEVAYSPPYYLYTRPFHPYIDKFQELMDRSLEAGLHQAWEIFFWEIWKVGEERKKPEEENDLLDLKLIAPFFLILAFGFSAALVALLCEFFYRDFVSQLSKEYFKRKWNEIMRREIKIQRKIKARRIQVKPA